MEEHLEHHGVVGQKWGVRRYQNKDGTLTRAGQKRFKQVSKSKQLQRKQTQAAIKVVTKQKNDAFRKLNKLNKKIDSKKNPNKKLIDKKNAQQFVASQLNTYLNGMNSKTVIAGKDYIVNKRILKIPYAYIGLTGPKIGTVSIGKNSVIFK